MESIRKSIYLNNHSAVVASTMPPLFRLGQYDLELNQFGFSKKVQDIKGNMGYGSGALDFNIDFAMENLPWGVDGDPFKEIHLALMRKQYVTFRFKSDGNSGPSIIDWDNKYYILKIADYGNQTMSPYYFDFIPQVWVKIKNSNNQYVKIHQRYVGVIRHYTSKQVYLLISKTNNIPKTNIDDSPLFNIRLAFKDAIEEKVTSNNTNLTFLELIKESNGTYKVTSNNKYYSSLLLKNGKENIWDTFDLFFSIDNNTTKYKLYNDKTFFLVSQVETTGSRNASETEELGVQVIFKQTGNSEKGVEDYFKQQLKRTYENINQTSGRVGSDPDKPFDYEYKNDIKINVNITENTNVKFYIKPRSEQLDALYLTSITNSDDSEGNSGKISIKDIRDNIYFYRTEDLNIYDLDGKKVNIGYDSNFNNIIVPSENKEYEIIPEFSNIRKFEWPSITSNDSNNEETGLFSIKEMDIRRDSRIYPWKIEKSEYLIFDKDGYLEEFGAETWGYNGGSHIGVRSFNENKLIIYDNGIESNDIPSSFDDTKRIDNEMLSLIPISGLKDYSILTDERLLDDGTVGKDTVYNISLPIQYRNDIKDILERGELIYKDDDLINNKEILGLYAMGFSNDYSDDPYSVEEKVDNYKERLNRLADSMNNIATYQINLEQGNEGAIIEEFEALSKIIVNNFLALNSSFKTIKSINSINSINNNGDFFNFFNNSGQNLGFDENTNYIILSFDPSYVVTGTEEGWKYIILNEIELESNSNMAKIIKTYFLKPIKQGRVHYFVIFKEMVTNSSNCYFNIPNLPKLISLSYGKLN